MTFKIAEFIDIHTHILPGLDDGAKDLGDSIAIARCYASVGIKTVVATPHFLPGTAWTPSKEIVLDSVQALQSSLDNEHIDLKIVPGMEIAFHKKLGERLSSNSLLSLGNSGHYLIEPSFHGEQDSLLASLQSLLNKGYKLILAHPERVDGLRQKLKVIENLVEQGLLIQVNTGSFLGYFGPKSKDTAELLHQKNCLHFIASDAHDHSKRAPLNDIEWQNLINCQGGVDILTSCNRNIAERFFTTPSIMTDS